MADRWLLASYEIRPNRSNRREGSICQTGQKFKRMHNRSYQLALNVTTCACEVWQCFLQSRCASCWSTGTGISVTWFSSYINATKYSTSMSSIMRGMIYTTVVLNWALDLLPESIISNATSYFVLYTLWRPPAILRYKFFGEVDAWRR